jgi:signal transduction histidine kinase
LASFSQFEPETKPATDRSGRSRAAAGAWECGIHLEALANLAHELRTPVQVLLGYVDILLDDMDEELGPRSRRVIERLHVNAHDLAQTVENVMDFAVALARAEAPAEEDVVLADLVAEIVPVLEAANDAKKIMLSIDIDGAPAVVHTRRRPLRTIVLNLAVNAIKFTEKGSVQVRIQSLPSRRTCTALEVKVRDTGPGMDPARVADAFRPGLQLSNSSVRRHRGMGLGLAVVRRNAAALGAELDVTTAPNQGATFTVRIPIGRDPT